ncbi:hypothetical protein Taro_014677 [Colocasia esculenta]|uniref:Aminotransferase-like plant mobile domain-containing protein n=1 Tax=Colocasia esculenta TaxID=4460 RepID=A0A843UJF4_COLES|nr:hypothetical protein [Colocasia esculenta]
MASSSTGQSPGANPGVLSEVPGHLSTRLAKGEEIPAFPSQGQVRAFSWLVNLVNAITLDMRSFIGMWHLNFMVVLAKNMKDMWWGFDALGALVERWHPHTHTFVFQGFEASVLLEESSVYCSRAWYEPEGEIKCVTAHLKSRDAWRDHLAFLVMDDFIVRPLFMRTIEFRAKTREDRDLWLIGAGQMVVYQPHRCHCQLGIPRGIPTSFNGTDMIVTGKNERMIKKSNEDLEEVYGEQEGGTGGAGNAGRHMAVRGFYGHHLSHFL